MKHDTPEPGSFLERWSRRKRGVGSEADTDTGLLPPDGTDIEPDLADPQAAHADSGEAEPAVEKDFADFNFDELDYESDYKQFMEKDVSPEARHKALRKLWVSNPVLANMDGLDDYCEDYTDAAVCMPKGTMKTLYQYGRGFLDDDEVAEWEALGHEPKEVAADAAPEVAETVVAADATEDLSAQADPLAGDDPRDTGPGAACAVSVKQADADMLAEFEADNGSDEQRKA